MPCIKGEILPTEEEKLPQQMWLRPQIQPTFQNPKANGILANATIALACPATMVMNQTCNNFLCPLDCQTTDWSDWSACTAACDGGGQQKAREVVRVQRSGGVKCPPTQESRECNKHACDVDCVLHEDFVTEDGCLQACTPDGKNRFEILEKHIKVPVVGNGDCPGKHSWDERVVEGECDDRKCQGDEICGEVMDLVVMYECSATVTRLGCWFMASFVVALLNRMPTVAWGLPTMQISLVKFGNGISRTIDGGKSYFVNPAVRISKLTGDLESLSPAVYGDVLGLWTGRTKYHLGFNNIGQGLKLASEVLDESTRVEGDITASKKIVILTKGKRAGCTVVKSIAESLKICSMRK